MAHLPYFSFVFIYMILSFCVCRFLDTKGACSEEKFSYVPFGAGRHRCIGESFAYIQIKSIWSMLLRKYEFQLVNGQFPSVNVTTMIHTPNDPVIKYRLRASV